jgi:osmotically-inducible protein OsmY
MKKTFVLMAVGTVSILSADYYQPQYQQTPYSCPGGNCPYNQQQYYQGSQPQYYQGSQPQYYQSTQPQYYQDGSQTYYQGNPSQSYQRNPQQYNQQQYHQQANQGYYQKASWDNTSTSSQQGVSDADIAKKVHDAISSGWLTKGYEGVSFDVMNGTVILRGSVETNEDKQKIEESVKEIDGVKQVNNQITVRGQKTAYNSSYSTSSSSTKMANSQDYAASENDRKINANIRKELSGGWFSKGYDAIMIRTTDGAVVITGVVDTPNDIQTINNAVKKVDGVKSVNNQVTPRSSK